MKNFDFTQFITFDSSINDSVLYGIVNNIFRNDEFSVIKKEDIMDVKKDYYRDYIHKYLFELVNDDFLSEFMEWKEENMIPQKIQNFIGNVEKLLEYDVKNVSIIICSFAERGTTNDEIINVIKENINSGLFRMSIHSFDCPNNLILNIE